MNFSNVDISVFIEFYSELTGRNFIVDPRVKGSVTILSADRISMADLEAVFLSTLEVNGFSTVEAGQVTKIVPSAVARTMGIDTRSSGGDIPPIDLPVTQIVPLIHADATELKSLLALMVSRTAFIGAYPESNVLLITDTAANVIRLLSIIRELDTEDAGRELTRIPLDHSDGGKLATLLTTMFEPTSASKKSRGPSRVTIVADERTNALIVVADRETTRRIQSLVGLLDRKARETKGKIRVYPVKNADVEELIKTLRDLPNDAGTSDAVTSEIGTPGSGTEQAGAESAGTRKAGTGGMTRSKGSVLPATLKVMGDPATNSLIVTAEEEQDFQLLEAIVQELDLPREMVYIEALVMEVDARKNLQLGVEWTAVGETQIGGKAAAVGGGFVNQAAQSALPGLASGLLPFGFSMGVFTEAIEIAGVQFSNLTALVRALKEDRSVSIVSTPQILTIENEEAKITVAQNLPFQSGTSTFQDDVFTTFEYRDVGTTLSVTPQIGPEGTVTLAISLELSVLESTTDFKPTTLKRTIDTDVLLNDASTLVIGGLIEDNRVVSEFKVPLLGDIPLLGWLFKFQSDAQQKTNLYIFLTPRVVKQSAAAADLSELKRRTLDTKKPGHIKQSNAPIGYHERLQP